MAFKRFALDDITVTIYKRRGSRNLRVTVRPDGEVRVSIPAWAAYPVGVQFARSRLDWIRAQLQATSLPSLRDGQSIGKAHHLYFMSSAAVTAPRTRLQPSAITVTHPPHLTSEHNEVQAAAQRASVRALRVQAENLLPQRLQKLAATHGLSYRSVSIKRMTGRWGSCDQQQRIVLNLYLMLLPWPLIDYVLLHELAHTQVLRHGPDFWQVLEKLSPTAKADRKALRAYQPAL
jgi:predicted metal-dependent hydrolase